MQRLRHVYVWSLLLLVLTHATLAEVAGSNQAGFDKFIRYTKTPGKLETSVVSFQNSRDQIIDLIAAVHIGSSAYYDNLNRQFKSYDAVLYELVLPDEMAGQRLPSQMETGSGVSGMQGMMAKSLGLTTQIGKVDYSAENFVHADLTQSGLSQAMNANQESVMGYVMQAMASGELDESSLGISEQELAQIDFMAILNGTAKPKDRQILRKLFASALASSGGLMSTMGGTALIKARNEAAMKVVDKQSAAGKRRLALFYGAAHMPDLEKRLRAKGWRKTSSKWLKAWSI